MPLISPLRVWAVALVSSLTLLACGVPVQDTSRELEPMPAPAQVRPSTGEFCVTIYLVREDRLQPVQRSTRDTALETTLAILAQGPTAEELARGLATAVPPQALDAAHSDATDVVTLSATHRFTEISGDDQLLAAAQLVWTVTETHPGDRVRMTVDGEFIDMPTDTGLTRRPTSRSDYESVAPPVVTPALQRVEPVAHPHSGWCSA